jgi:hypothetical protein
MRFLLLFPKLGHYRKTNSVASGRLFRARVVELHQFVERGTDVDAGYIWVGGDCLRDLLRVQREHTHV